VKSSSVFAGAILSTTLTALSLVGCAQNPDVRAGHDFTSGYTQRSPQAYLGCVKGELPSNVKTYQVATGDSLKLYVQSIDPDKADGLIELRGTGNQHAFTAYQRDAWYDHGRLLDAALMCKRV
jgi:hypothetical protein